MATNTAKLHDLCLDQYADDDNKVIVMSLFKHGSSTLSNTFEQTKHNFTLIKNKTEFASNETIVSFNEAYSDYEKYITYRSFDDVWVSAFCYETRTSHFRGLLDGDTSEVKTKIRSMIETIGGAEAFVGQDLATMNGTYMALSYATRFPSIAELIVENCMPINVSSIPVFLDRYCEGVELDKHVNKTPDDTSKAVSEVFHELEIDKLLREKYQNDYVFKECLKEKLSA